MDFLKNPRRFSMLLDGVPIWDKNPEVSVKTEADTVITTVKAGNLLITNTARRVEPYGAYEWVNRLENVGDEPTALISQLWDCDCRFDFPYEQPLKTRATQPDPAGATKIDAPTGSTWAAEEFYCDVDRLESNRRINHIYPGQTREYSTEGGRSSVRHAPFFHI